MAGAESPRNVIELNKLLGNEQITVMLVGAAGAGKSSLINSLIKLVQISDVSPHMKLNSYIPTAPAQLMGGHTMMIEQVDLTDKLTILDNRGWHDWTKEEALHELIAQIRGERDLDDDVNWEEGAQDALPFAVSPKVDSISIVINGEGGLEAIEGIRGLIDTCRRNVGRRPTVVITHKDEVIDEQIKDKTAILESYSISRQNIFVVQNVTESDDNLEANSAVSLCKFIERCNIDGKVRVKNRAKMEERDLKIDNLREQREVEERSKEIKQLIHDVEVTKLNEPKIQLQIQTDIEKQRASVEEKIMLGKQKLAQRKYEMEEAIMLGQQNKAQKSNEMEEAIMLGKQKNAQKANEVEATIILGKQKNAQKANEVEEAILLGKQKNAKKANEVEEAFLIGKQKNAQKANEVDEAIMVVKQKNVQRTNEVEEKYVEKSNKKRTERYEKYLDDLYTQRLNEDKNS